jgi:hypothetical protein
MVTGAATRFAANGQAAMIRPYRKNILAKGEEKIRFDSVSEDGEKYVGSCYAYASTGVAAELHRHHGYRVRFSDNPRYPRILEVIEEVPLPKIRRDLGTQHCPAGTRLLKGILFWRVEPRKNSPCWSAI